MKFSLPANFVLPDGVEPGQDFDAVVTLNLGSDGSVTVLALDGSPISEVEEEDEPEEAVESEVPTEEADFVGAVAADLAV